jgi:hypothetical protein
MTVVVLEEKQNARNPGNQRQYWFARNYRSGTTGDTGTTQGLQSITQMAEPLDNR